MTLAMQKKKWVLIRLHHIWKDHKRKDQPWKEKLTIEGAVNHFLLRVRMPIRPNVI